MKYFIKTFGCQLNEADSQRIAAQLETKGMKKAIKIAEADCVVINTCVVRQSAEERIYGLIRNLNLSRKKTGKPQEIIITGCLTKLTGIPKIKSRLDEVDQILPISEIGFNIEPISTNKDTAFVPISHGCNNFCSFCVVPFARGPEVSRPFEDIIKDCKKHKTKGVKNILLLGQNVNSYGADLNLKDIDKSPVYVKHLGKTRIPTLFPYLLDEVAKMNFEKVEFMSSNPWDFSDDLIKTIANNPNISRTIHLPIQSGDNRILELMNRWYTAKQYLQLIKKIKKIVPKAIFTTDIIVGFPTETENQFKNTVNIIKKVGFKKAYVSLYSPRPMTKASKELKDEIPFAVKRNRWLIIEEVIKNNLRG
jgi:tRNA-2-methylthio-N6-dimethylallyladenosine synthase